MGLLISILNIDFISFMNELREYSLYLSCNCMFDPNRSNVNYGWQGAKEHSRAKPIEITTECVAFFVNTNRISFRLLAFYPTFYNMQAAAISSMRVLI